MSGIHEAIEERWQATEALLALVPLDRSCVGNFPSYQARAGEPVYPRVARKIQFSQKEHYTSDRKIWRTTVLFRLSTHHHEDGQAFLEAFEGTAGVDGFENQHFDTTDIWVLKCRVEDFGEFQDDDGQWEFLMPVEFLWYKLPTVVIVVPTEETLMYSQIADATIDNSAAETSLVSTGPGVVEVAANSQSVGDKFILEAAGYYKTKTTGPGSIVIKVKWGTELTLTFPTVEFLGAQDDERWFLRAAVTRRSIGPTGVVRGHGILFTANASPNPGLAGTNGDVTVPTDAAKSFAVTGDFSLADADNEFYVEQLDIQQLSVA